MERIEYPNKCTARITKVFFMFLSILQIC